jgi:hypothetical protein
MVLGHGRRDDQRSGRIDVRRIVPGHRDAEPFEISGGFRVGIATGDGDTPPKKELGERAHAGPGDTYEMDWSGVV